MHHHRGLQIFASGFMVAMGVFVAPGGLNSLVQAAPIVLADAYGGQNNSAVTCCSGDVIGALKGFDIESITFTNLTSTNITTQIRLNYNYGDATLSPYTVHGWTLAVGDVLFGVGGVWKYGVSLVSHDGFDAGDLYAITGTRSSNYYLGGSGFIWRYNTPVRMDPTGKNWLGTGSVANANIGGAEVLSTVGFTPSAAFFHDLTTTGLDVSFASAVCANDILQGHIQATVPEPTTLLLYASGVGGLLLWRRSQKA